MMPGSRFEDNNQGTFTVWAPHRRRVELEMVSSEKSLIEMHPCDESFDREVKIGYWQLALPDIQPSARYLFRLDGTVSRPDPASNYQPDGVHGPS